MKSFSPWNSTESEKIEFLKSNPFSQTIKNQNRLYELEELIQFHGGAMFIIRMLNEIREVVLDFNINHEGDLTPEFMNDVRHTLNQLQYMFINIHEIDVNYKEDEKLIGN